MNVVELIKEEVLKSDKEDQKTRGYSFYEEHIKYVVKNAINLAEKYEADIEIVELAALLHDIAKISNIGTKEDHHINGATIAEELLTKYNYPKDRIERIKQCILKHRGSVTIPRNTIEEEIIADADAISHFDNIALLFFTAIKRKDKNIKEASLWVKKKIDKDYNKLSVRTKLELKERYENITIVFFIISLVSGLITNDLLLGGSILFTGLLCAYLATEAKRSNYIVSFINYVITGYVCYKNNLYGAASFCILVFAPLQIHGYITWKSNVDEEDIVDVREFTLKNSVIITLSCIISSFILGYLLSLIPSQRLAFLDATSNIINLCGVILMILRFKECWWIWITNNIIDLCIWIINVINRGENATMVLLVSIGYFLINIYGIISWNIKAKKGRKI